MPFAFIPGNVVGVGSFINAACVLRARPRGRVLIVPLVRNTRSAAGLSRNRFGTFELQWVRAKTGLHTSRERVFVNGRETPRRQRAMKDAACRARVGLQGKGCG